MVDAGHRQVALGVQGGHAAEAGAGDGGAVIGVLAGDEDRLLRLAEGGPIMPDHAEHGVVGLGAGIDEEYPVEMGRGDFGQLLGQLHRRRVGGLEESVVIGQLEHLGMGGVGDRAAAIADLHAPQSGHAVENAVAV